MSIDAVIDKAIDELWNAYDDDRSGRLDKDQAKNMDFLLYMGEMFTLVAYGELILEKYKM